MTDKQINAARATLPRGILWAEWPEEAKRLSRELDCRDMYNSCLCYGTTDHFWKGKTWGDGAPLYMNYADTLGRARVEEICKEQEEDIARARILRNVFTDSEGLSYNSIVWADEEVPA